MGFLPTKAVDLLGSAEWPNNEAESGTSRKGVNELERQGCLGPLEQGSGEASG